MDTVSTKRVVARNLGLDAVLNELPLETVGFLGII